MLYFVIFLIIVFVSSNLIIDVVLTESFLAVKLFGIRVLYVKEEKLKMFFYKVIDSGINGEDSGSGINFLRHINILNLKIVLNTIVNDYNFFLLSNSVLMKVIRSVYPSVKKYIPNVYYCYKSDEKNSFKLESKLKLNLFVSLLSFLKGKKRYVSKRN